MNRLFELVLFACCVITATALCTESKYLNNEQRNWLTCSKSSLDEIRSRLKMSLAAITVSYATIPEIPGMMFARNATTMEEMTFQSCNTTRIANDAFRGLASLKKLVLSHNELKELNATWFYDLTSLEQLDVSFNKISRLDPNIYFHLSKVRRFDVNDNALSEIPLTNLENMNGLKEIRIQENPITYLKRAKLTLFLKDHGIGWATDDDGIALFENVLWECFTSLPKNSPIRDAKMNTCVIWSMFNQLITLLYESPTKFDSAAQCSPFKKSLTTCLKNNRVKTNGRMLMHLLALTYDASGANHLY